MKTIVSDTEVQVSVLKAAGGWAVYGITLNEWVAIATFIYMVAQTVVLILRYLRETRKS